MNGEADAPGLWSSEHFLCGAQVPGKDLDVIQSVIEMELPVGEKLAVKKNRILPEKEARRPRRISIVSGTHGDELEGQYVCYEIARRLREDMGHLEGIVDLYPALNPMGIHLASHSIPRLELDMNRTFPGDPAGDMTEKVAAAVVEDIAGSDFCVDVHASDIFVQEIPQVRISQDFAEKLLPYAKLMNVDMIWVNATATVHESTLAHSMNLLGVPTLVVEMGLGSSIHMGYGSQVVDGIFRLMKELGIWSGKTVETQMPAISSDGRVEFVRSDVDGIFLPRMEHNHLVRKGGLIGEVVDPFEGTVKRRILAGENGLLFTLRTYPVVYAGSLLARILMDN